MGDYNNILVVVELAPSNSFIVTRARQLAAATPATITLLHVLESIPMESMGETILPAVQMEKALLESASDQLAQLASEQGLSGSRQIVAVGGIKAEIQRVALEMAADLIVVGNHERHGLQALVNFTEDAVLHVAPCDVLAVHLPQTVPTPRADRA